MAAKVFTRLLILLGIIIGIGLFVFFAQRYQVTRMNQSVLARAAEAEKDKNYEQAAQLYQEHLEMVPNDQAVMAKLADVILEGTQTPTRQDLAAALYTQVLTRSP